MADTTIIAPGLPTGWAAYTLVRESDDVGTPGDAWDGSDYVPFDPGDWPSYATATPETPGGSGTYVCQFPLTSPVGWYTWETYKQVGGAPDPGDPVVAQSVVPYYWNGSEFLAEGPAANTPQSTGIASALNGLGVVYCTDENIALRSWGDYSALVPASQKLAAGTDGAILPSDRWTLSSATADFLGAGVLPGCMVLLKVGNTFGSNGELFAVQSVATGTVTLRRQGQAAGIGQPPAPAAGLTGVTFSILTFGPQIDVASYDANHFFGIDPISPTRAPGKMYDQRELQSYVVLTVLKRAYAIQVKQKAEDYMLKFEHVESELSDLAARLTIRWGARGDDAPPTSIFSCRARR